MNDREEEVTNAEMQQRLMAQNLREKEKELAQRESDLVLRELHLLMQQPTPTPHKRNGKFKRNKLLRLLKKKELLPNISSPRGEFFFDRFPSNFSNSTNKLIFNRRFVGFRHTVSVQSVGNGDRSRDPSVQTSPSGSPSIPRLRAFASKFKEGSD